MGMFRYLRADEIDVRVARNFKNGVQLLFYKDARVDQNILDETVGPMNWQRRHDRNNANCIVSIWDDKKQQWISKEDTGTESNTEAEKGLASDSFKRACFNWGIGRELYTAPDTCVWNSTDDKGNVTVQRFRTDDKTGKCKDRFSVKELNVTDGVITHVVVYNENLKKVVFSYGKSQEIQPVTNETVKQAVNAPAVPGSVPAADDMNASANEIELAQLEEMAKKAYPKKTIDEIHGMFPNWPSITKAKQGEWMRQIKDALERHGNNGANH